MGCRGRQRRPPQPLSSPRVSASSASPRCVFLRTKGRRATIPPPGAAPGRGRRATDNSVDRSPPAPRARIDFALLLACFLASGIAGLIYQTAWTQQFTLVFGASELAVVAVLAAY